MNKALEAIINNFPIVEMDWVQTDENVTRTRITNKLEVATKIIKNFLDNLDVEELSNSLGKEHPFPPTTYETVSTILSHLKNACEG